MMCVRYQGLLYRFRTLETLRAFLKAHYGQVFLAATSTAKAAALLGFILAAQATGQYLTGGI